MEILGSNEVLEGTILLQLGVQVRNLKVEFKTGGTWRRAINSDNEYLCLLIRLSCLVSKACV